MTNIVVHAPVMCGEAIKGLAVKADGIYVDGTFGRGGHTRAILDCLGREGRVIALDRDPEAVAAGKEIRDDRLCVLHAPFSQVRQVVEAQGVQVVDGVLLDLGVSSPQLDEGRRGMSFRNEGPLDMRMDTTQGVTAGEWLATATVERIREVLKNYGDERFANAIAKAIADARSRGLVSTTGQLAAIVEKTVRTREPGKHPATRSFQALRIFVNQELEELTLVLPAAVELLKPSGRLAVISFHSLEDRIVKRFMRTEAQPAHVPARLPLRADELPAPRLRLVGRKQFPSEEEIRLNPRSRSAVLRVAERCR